MRVEVMERCPAEAWRGVDGHVCVPQPGQAGVAQFVTGAEGHARAPAGSGEDLLQLSADSGRFRR